MRKMFTKDSSKKYMDKIKRTKLNSSLIYDKIYYYINSGKNISEIIKLLDINYMTVWRLWSKMDIIAKINGVTLENALRNFIFKSDTEVKIFEFMKKDINFFKKFNDVKKVVPTATRYYYKNVKKYILSEINEND